MLRPVLIAASLLTPAVAWAQAVEVSHAVTGITDSLLDKGTLGVVSLIGLLATGWLAWSYNKLWAARLSDAKAAADDLRAANREMTEALSASAKTSAAVAVALEAHSRDADRRHTDLREDLVAIQDVKTIVTSNASAMARIEADVRPQGRGQR